MFRYFTIILYIFLFVSFCFEGCESNPQAPSFDHSEVLIQFSSMAFYEVSHADRKDNISNWGISVVDDTIKLPLIFDHLWIGGVSDFTKMFDGRTYFRGWSNFSDINGILSGDFKVIDTLHAKSMRANGINTSIYTFVQSEISANSIPAIPSTNVGVFELTGVDIGPHISWLSRDSTSTYTDSLTSAEHKVTVRLLRLDLESQSLFRVTFGKRL